MVVARCDACVHHFLGDSWNSLPINRSDCPLRSTFGKPWGTGTPPRDAPILLRLRRAAAFDQPVPNVKDGDRRQRDIDHRAFAWFGAEDQERLQPDDQAENLDNPTETIQTGGTGRLGLTIGHVVFLQNYGVSQPCPPSPYPLPQRGEDKRKLSTSSGERTSIARSHTRCRTRRRWQLSQKRGFLSSISCIEFEWNITQRGLPQVLRLYSWPRRRIASLSERE